MNDWKMTEVFEKTGKFRRNMNHIYSILLIIKMFFGLGGTMNMEWIERNIGCTNWRNLTSLCLPDCKIKTVMFSPESLPNILNLDLSRNGTFPNCRVLINFHYSIFTFITIYLRVQIVGLIMSYEY
jgi:hypothetical protein